VRHFIVVFLVGTLIAAQAFAVEVEYINGLYIHRNCEYFSNELKKNWEDIPENQRNDFLSKLADCSVERGQLEFAESLFRNLEKKNYNSSILNQAKAKLDLSRSDFKKVTDDYETNKPLKATFQYYIYVAQSYYEQENYDASLKVLTYISPTKLTDYQRNIIRYWKAKNYFLKDEYDKTTYFLDLILDEKLDNWVTDAAQVLQNAVTAKYRPFRAVIYTNATYDTNANKESVSTRVTNDDIPESYIIDGTYRINPSLDFYVFKNKTQKKYINLDFAFNWSSKEIENDTETYSVKFRNSRRTDSRNTFSWDLGFTKSQANFKDSSNDAFGRLGLFHLITNDKFATVSYRYSKNTEFLYKSSHTVSLSLFKIYDSQLLYGTVTRIQAYDHEANYEFNGSSAPYAAYGTPFSNYGYTSIDLAHSIDFTDIHTLRTQLSYANIAYQKENLPAGADAFTNSNGKRTDETYSFSLVYSNKYSDETNVELFATTILGLSRGHQGYKSTTFINKNYTANQFGINVDWTYE
jgi:hypothetical protein